jgi:hypothetical protein
MPAPLFNKIGEFPSNLKLFNIGQKIFWQYTYFRYLKTDLAEIIACLFESGGIYGVYRGELEDENLESCK